MSSIGDSAGSGIQGMAAAQAMLPISVCIVAFNEAPNIAEAITPVIGWAREVVVLNCESTDDTAEVARAAGAIVFDVPNVLPEINKNISFERARSEWVFSLDADEVVTEELKVEIARTIAANPVENGFRMPRRNHYFGVPLTYGGQWPNRQLRLFRRGRGRFPGIGPHEVVAIDGAIGELSAPMDHHPYPTFDVWLRKFDFYTRLGADVLAQRQVPLTVRSIRHHMIWRPLRRWLERLLLQRGLRDGVPGIFAATADLITNVASFLRYWMASRGG
ncbi:MAG: glycosyltransferase family 2 protein [Bacteroidetes bacterium]|nr:glycosyltransferase family 2 protein [Bacteroidota bacterium]